MVLAVINLLELVQPICHCSGRLVKLNSVDEHCGSSGDGPCNGRLPHGSRVHVSIPLIGVVVVDAGQSCFIQAEACCDECRPLGFEFDVRNVSLTEDHIE